MERIARFLGAGPAPGGPWEQAVAAAQGMGQAFERHSHTRKFANMSEHAGALPAMRRFYARHQTILDKVEDNGGWLGC